jgi:hypothetical protein
MRDPHNLIALHEHSTTGQGRRHRETTLNRAAVVLCVAAWQAFVEDTARAILDDLAVPHGTPSYGPYKIVKALVSTSLGRFNTPNSRNSLALLNDLGFDSQPAWSFSMTRPNRQYAPATVGDEIDEWLAVRHAIAHGFDRPEKQVLTGRANHRPSIRKTDAERCIGFFENVVGFTADSAHLAFP